MEATCADPAPGSVILLEPLSCDQMGARPVHSAGMDGPQNRPLLAGAVDGIQLVNAPTIQAAKTWRLYRGVRDTAHSTVFFWARRLSLSDASLAQGTCGSTLRKRAREWIRRPSILLSQTLFW